MKQKKLLDLKNARLKEQKKKMKKIITDGVCPFCPKYLKKYHDHPIEKIGKFWAVTKNDYPYKGSKIHYLFIYKRHIENISQISPLSLVELTNQIKALIKKHKIPGGALVMRFGDSDYTSASVTHLHAHLISGGKIQKNENEELNVPVGYKLKK